MTRKTYIQRNGKLYEKGTEPPLPPKGPLIIPDIKPFRSPITGEPITSRPKLQRHMKEHGVTRAEDYSPEWREKKNRERLDRLYSRTPQDRQERIEALKYAVEKHRVR